MYYLIRHKYFGIAEGGFDIISSQFSMHYYFQSRRTFDGFIRNLKENIKRMQESLENELKLSEDKKRIPKQIFKYKKSNRIKENIMSLEYSKKFQEKFPLITKCPPLSLQRKNGSFHKVLGFMWLPTTDCSGWTCKMAFYVIEKLHGDAYLSTETIDFLLK